MAKQEDFRITSHTSRLIQDGTQLLEQFLNDYQFNEESDDFINFNGGTTGGVAGSWVQIVAIAALKYMVQGVALGSGTVATPFATS